MAEEQVNEEAQEELNLEGQEETKEVVEESASEENAAKDGGKDTKTLLSDDEGDGTGDKDSDKGVVPDKYEFKPPEDFDLSEEVQSRLDAFTDRARDMKLSQEQYQAIIDYDIERGKSALADQASAYHERIKMWGDEVVADKEFGGENLEANLSIIRKVKEGYGDESFQKILDAPSPENPDGLGLGNHPAMLRFLHRIGKSINDSEFFEGDGHKAEGENGLRRLYPTMFEKQAN